MKITELILDASNLGPLYEFYAGDLGLPAARPSLNLLSFQVGATRLQFRRGPGRPFYHYAFNVHPARFERARATVAAITPLLHGSDGEEIFDFRSWDARACYFYDPAGNVVELIARRDLSMMPAPPDPGWMSVSEIGLVSEDVAALTSRIGRELKLPIYRESAGETFAAVGDAEGLLILVQRGRVWYPETGKPAVLAPLAIDLQAADARWQVKGPPYQFARSGSEQS